ncbi:MAG: peptidylprolyl isomerase [Planctomycetota bacterium]
MKPAIADGHVVTIHYKLTLDDGSVADQSLGGEPLVYLHGAQNIVPGLERQLAGRKVGDKVDCVVPANEGYGEYDPAAEQAVPRNQVPADADVQVGMAFQTRGRDGRAMTVFVREVMPDTVTITSNHPMAGQRLNFAIAVVDVRRATPEEKKHGHAHGPGGHHHH